MSTKTDNTNNTHFDTVRVRFAPSPTGKLHIGGARTAIYNWAFARTQGGSFILRIEDTDPTRSTKENTDLILRSMKWLGLDWDEGPDVEGNYGPYKQMERMDTYKLALEILKEKGYAYPCFCTKEELDNKRALAEKNGGAYSGYDRTCRTISKSEAKQRIESGEAHVWRFAVPKNHGPIEFDDAVYGHVSFPLEVMDDMVLVRSDGSPTYNFAVVCDDINMRISHVIRGDDHLSNTPRQILIYEALGAPIPTFAHLSMILGPDGKKLSKRHGATSVEEYQHEGYLPEAVVNFLALLGWSLDGETTIIPRDVLCSNFSLDRITKKDALFDQTKLDWMNGVYIRKLTPDAWIKLSKPWLEMAVATGMSIEPSTQIIPSPQAQDSQNSCSQKTNSLQVSPEISKKARIYVEEHPRLFMQIFPHVQERLDRLDEIVDKIAFMFWGNYCKLDEKSFNKVLKKDAELSMTVLMESLNIFKDNTIPWKSETLQDACKNLCETLDIKARFVFQPLRVAITGNMVSPPLFELVELMHREEIVARIEGVLDLLRKQ